MATTYTVRVLVVAACDHIRANVRISRKDSRRSRVHKGNEPIVKVFIGANHEIHFGSTRWETTQPYCTVSMKIPGRLSLR
jgi:hypothetical protein